jgi:hypothetical protein
MRHTCSKYLTKCNCRSVGECCCNDLVELRAINALVNDFADNLRSKLMRKMTDRSGWDDPTWTKEEIIKQLVEHINKGDMIDVAAFAMFAWNKEE